MSIEIVPFEAGLGAEIRGIDLRQPLSREDRDAIRAAWLGHLVLRFREQAMDDAQHMAFARQFGELEFNPAALIARQYGIETQSDGRRREVPPEISVISNIIEDGKAIGGLGDGEAFWHTDSSFVDVPPAASLLRSLEIPPPSACGSGATYFLNMYSAYHTLPRDTKARIDGLTMIHAATHSSGGKAHKGFETVADVSKVPGARQPLVRTHPETGKKALFLGRRINAYVIGLTVADSEAVLDELWSHTTQEKFTWRQDWLVGDLIWWDNRCAMHRRDAFDPASRRLMHRTQLKGTRPV
ncbi:MAG: TauD/TfdA dioxygenase family protein [Stellaceae bacterium]